MIVIAAGLYGAGILSLRRRGLHWSLKRTAGFYLLGLGSFAVIEFGFLGVYSQELRFAFTTRIALLLFAVPALVATGKPVALAREALSTSPRGAALLERVIESRVIGVMGNAVFGPVFALVAFSVFLTPIAGSLRGSTVAQDVITVVVPLVGLVLVLPLTELVVVRTSLFIVAEFMLAFVELVVDAIPGILLRLNDQILDHAAPFVGATPVWFPSPLRDQQLSGDLLWFIAEIADIPILILLFVRWSKHDRTEAKSLDDLTDDEMAALTKAHLDSFTQRPPD
ncbi:cytochrome c oxidase assembly protein [Subtercola boreus]|uniref:Cytochrome C oxidase assembly protein n=1 Tax=Subtercola boreus TaxID=120213 RepID=A0A3E0WEP9_9MICO|nr:cytochrome c oxidase assembly protein [Subtercola boreus]RFA22584.1 cytochrome C oxidase assembly protein [Subtercola boreus]RFA22940.1 cytochrome C oxidase assembly protein [Subtercola boreus]RFA28691.1 cytochrome C oxidase assembly protein [Subtercola boreus]